METDVCEARYNLHFEECVCCEALYDIEADAPRGAWGGICRLSMPPLLYRNAVLVPSVPL